MNTLDRPLEAPRRTLLFFLLAFGITWAACFPALLSQRGVIATPVESWLPLLGVGSLGPLLAALIVSGLETGRPGMRALFRPLGEWHANKLWWYLVALGSFGAILAVGMAVYGLFGDPLPLFYPPSSGPALIALVVNPIAEQIGWRAFAFPRLERRWSSLWASVILGVAWAVWHTPIFLLTQFDANAFALSYPYFIAGSVVLTWLQKRSGGGLPVVVLAHAGAHLNNSSQTLPGDATPFAVQTLGFCLVALLLAPSLVRRERSQ